MQRPVVQFLRLTRYPIFEQLKLEQALLRVAKGSWLLVNDGTPDPAIVMGVSGCEPPSYSSSSDGVPPEAEGGSVSAATLFIYL